MVNVTIDGVKVSVPERTTILEAARLAGINIPTLCYWKELNEIGACRVCVVEVEGFSRTSARFAEHLFSLSSDLPHHVGSIVDVDDIDLVMAFVGYAQTLVGSEFTLEQFFVYGGDDLFHGI